MNQVLNWNGNLATLESEVVPFSIVLPHGIHTFDFKIELANGTADQDSTNNNVQQSFRILNHDFDVQLDLGIDCFAVETTWEIVDSNEDVVYRGAHMKTRHLP